MLYFWGGFLFDEMITTVYLIVPMFAVYTSAILKYFIARKHIMGTRGREVNKAYVAITFSIPSIFVLFLTILVILKAFNIGLSNFEKFKTMLVLCESIFGVYIGLVLSDLFELSHTVRKNDDGGRG
jgi:hypothetical protein